LGLAISRIRTFNAAALATDSKRKLQVREMCGCMCKPRGCVWCGVCACWGEMGMWVVGARVLMSPRICVWLPWWL
jgi:hypothetical protein